MIETEEEATDKLISVMERKAEELIEDAVEDSREKYGPATTLQLNEFQYRIGVNSYFREIESRMDNRGFEISYRLYLKALVESYLNQVTPESTPLRGHNKAYPDLSAAHQAIADLGIDWSGEIDENYAGLHTDDIVWIYFFPEEAVIEMQKELESEFKPGGRWISSVDKNHLQALIKFPEVFNEHLVGSQKSYKNFLATFIHEITHNYIHSSISGRVSEYEVGRALDEGASSFCGLLVMHEESGIDWKDGLRHDEERYEMYGEKGIDPEKIYWIAELFRQRIVFILNSDNSRDNLKPVDLARNLASNYLTHHSSKYDGLNGFLLFMLPDSTESKIDRLRDMGEDSLERDIRVLRMVGERWRASLEKKEDHDRERLLEVLQEHVSELKTPSQIEKDIIEKIPGKVLEDEGGLIELIELVEKDIAREVEKIVEIEEILREIESQSPHDLQEKIEQALETIEESRVDLLSILNSLPDHDSG